MTLLLPETAADFADRPLTGKSSRMKSNQRGDNYLSDIPEARTLDAAVREWVAEGVGTPEHLAWLARAAARHLVQSEALQGSA